MRNDEVTKSLVCALALLMGACGPGASTHRQKGGTGGDDGTGGGGGGSTGTAGSTGGGNRDSGAGGGSTGGGGMAGGAGGSNVVRDGGTAGAGGMAGAGGAGGAAGAGGMGMGGMIAAGSGNVLTQKYDNFRTGWNAGEKVLTTANVNPMTFGKLFTMKVDGQVYAQPLVVSGVTVGGKVRNVVYVVTMHNTAYAFDADDKAAAGTPLWMMNVGTSAPKGPLCGCNDIAPEVGTTGTPAIDLATKTMYFASKHLLNGAYEYHLNALDLVTGMAKTGSPAKIAGQVAGTGDSTANGMVPFTPQKHHARPGILLQGGRVYIAFASHGDGRPYHGWVVSFDAAMMKQLAIFNTTPNSWGGGIWSSGNGLVGDGDSIYFSTGNGGTSAMDPPQLGEAFVKLDKDLKLVDWHIRGNYASLDGSDADYGMGGPIMLPKANILVTGGKDAWAFAYDRNNLGKFKMDDTNTLQHWKGGGGNTFNGMHSGSFIYWDQNPMGPTLYGWPGNSKLLGFKFNSTKFDETPIVVGAVNSPGVWSWGCMVGSSNAGMNGIIWASTPVQDNPNQKIVPGKLRAFNATNGMVIFDSTTNKTRDDTGQYASYSYPTVVNGKVYVPSWDNSTSTTPGGALHVFGLL